jgi:hypothetical protein
LTERIHKTGTLVTYRLCESDLEEITRRQQQGQGFSNTKSVGHDTAAVIVEDWGGHGCCNLMLLLDGAFPLWVGSRFHGGRIAQFRYEGEEQEAEPAPIALPEPEIVPEVTPADLELPAITEATPEVHVEPEAPVAEAPAAPDEASHQPDPEAATPTEEAHAVVPDLNLETHEEGHQ